MFELLNKSLTQQFFEKEWQAKNRWEFILLPSSLSIGPSLVSSAVNLAQTSIAGVGGLEVTKLHLREITFPPNVGFEYERLHQQIYVSKVLPPDTITMRLLEDENGTVIRYLRGWSSQIYVEPDALSLEGTASRAMDSVMNAFGSDSLSTGYVLRDNQVAAKRIGIILLSQKDGNDIPNYPRIILYGLMLQSVDPITLDHQTGEPLEYNITCAIERVFIPQTV